MPLAICPLSLTVSLLSSVIGNSILTFAQGLVLDAYS